MCDMWYVSVKIQELFLFYKIEFLNHKKRIYHKHVLKVLHVWKVNHLHIPPTPPTPPKNNNNMYIFESFHAENINHTIRYLFVDKYQKSRLLQDTLFHPVT